MSGPTDRSTRGVVTLCERALSGERLTAPELETLLAVDDVAAAGHVFAAAREARSRHFGDGVFLYGFIYFSTYCRNDCVFCYYRAGNEQSPRYRKTLDEVVAICDGVAASGVDLLDLTMGEDPVIHGEPGYQALLDLVTAVKASSGLPVMVSPGVLPREALTDLRERGADWYALYQETHTPSLYEGLRVGQAYAERVAARQAAHDVGLLVEDGILTGIGDTAADRAWSVAAMREGDWDQVRIMTFVPQAGTPLEGLRPAGDLPELLTIAVLRLVMPDRLIPASLDVDGIRGLERRLAAGANVVTSIVPPTSGLAGVSNAVLDIEEGYRTVEGVLPHLERLGLRPAGTAAYRAWLDEARGRRVAAGRPQSGESSMRLGVVGGKLQGTEAVYLAAKAGWETVLVDRHEAPPAAGLAGVFVQLDVAADEDKARAVLGACDAILPACEDGETLAWLDEHVPHWDVALLFDLVSYGVTASKLASNELFARLGAPRPRPWPCPFPVVVKPSSASGSEGVCLAADADALAAARSRLRVAGHDVVVEEYVPGPSLSLEVLCRRGRAVPLQVTGLEFDGGYDCKRVTAPVEASAALLAAFDDVAVRLAEGLGLEGLMDVEVMVADDEPKVLEIDARLPSQTPTAVYWSSGLNILEALAATMLDGKLPAIDREPRRACVYQHVHAAEGRLRVLGEHVMGVARPLALVPGFFGADEALTDYAPGAARWSATLITAADSVAGARARADACVAELAVAEQLEPVPEAEPARAVS